MTRKTEIFRPSFIVPERVSPPIQLRFADMPGSGFLANFAYATDFTFFATDPEHVIKIYEAARKLNVSPNGRLIFDNFWHKTAVFASPYAGVTSPLGWQPPPIYLAGLPNHLLSEKYVTFPSRKVWRFSPDTQIIHLGLGNQKEIEIAHMLASTGAERYLLSKTGSRDPGVLVGREFLDAYYRDLDTWLCREGCEENWGENVFRDPRLKYNLVFKNFFHQEVSRHLDSGLLDIHDGLLIKNKHITTTEDIGLELEDILKQAEEIDNGFTRHPRGWPGSKYIIDTITKHEFLRDFFPAKKHMRSLIERAESNLRQAVFTNLWGMEEVFSPGAGREIAPNTLGLIETRVLGQPSIQSEKVVVSESKKIIPKEIIAFPEPTTQTSVVDFWEGVPRRTKAESLTKSLDIPGNEFIHTEIKFHVNHSVYGTSASVANDFFNTLEEFRKISPMSEILYREVMQDMQQGKVMLCAYPSHFTVDFDNRIVTAAINLPNKFPLPVIQFGLNGLSQQANYRKLAHEFSRYLMLKMNGFSGENPYDPCAMTPGKIPEFFSAFQSDLTQIYKEFSGSASDIERHQRLCLTNEQKQEAHCFIFSASDGLFEAEFRQTLTPRVIQIAALDPVLARAVAPRLCQFLIDDLIQQIPFKQITHQMPSPKMGKDVELKLSEPLPRSGQKSEKLQSEVRKISPFRLDINIDQSRVFNYRSGYFLGATPESAQSGSRSLELLPSLDPLLGTVLYHHAVKQYQNNGFLMFAIDEPEVAGAATALWKKCEVVRGVFIEGHSHSINKLGTHLILPALDLSTAEGASDIGHELIHDLMDALFGRNGDLSLKLIPSFYKSLAKDYLRLEMHGGIMQLFTVNKPPETLIGIKDDFVRIADLDSSLAEQYMQTMSEQKNHQDYLEMAEAHVFKRPRKYLKDHIIKFLKNHSRSRSSQLGKRGDKIIANSIRLDAVGLSGEDYLLKRLSVLYSDIPVRDFRTIIREAYEYLRIETIAHWGNVRLHKDYRSEDFDNLHISRFCENIIKQVPAYASVAQYDSRNGADFRINAKLHSEFRLGVEFTPKTPLPLKKPFEYQGVVYRYSIDGIYCAATAEETLALYLSFQQIRKFNPEIARRIHTAIDKTSCGQSNRNRLPTLHTSSGRLQNVDVPAKHVVFMPKSGLLFSVVEDTVMPFMNEPAFILSQDALKKIRQNMPQESASNRNFFNAGFTAGLMGFQLGNMVREIGRLDIPFSEKMTIVGSEARAQTFNACFYSAFGPYALLPIAFFNALGTSPYDLLQDTLYPPLSKQEQLDLDKAFFFEAAKRIKPTWPDLRSSRSWEKWSQDLQKQSIDVMQDVLRQKHPRYRQGSTMPSTPQTVDTSKEEKFSWPRLLRAVLIPGFELLISQAHADDLSPLVPVTPPRNALHNMSDGGSVSSFSEIPAFYSNPQVALDSQRTQLALPTSPSQALQPYQIALPSTSLTSVVPAMKFATEEKQQFPAYVDSKLLEAGKSWYTPSSALNEIKFGAMPDGRTAFVNWDKFTLTAATEAGKISAALNINWGGFALTTSAEAGKISTALNITLMGANAASLSSLAVAGGVGVAVAALLKMIDVFKSGSIKRELEKLEEHKERTKGDYAFIMHSIVNPLQKMIESGEINHLTSTGTLIGYINHLQEKIELVRGRKKTGIDLFNKLIKRAQRGLNFDRSWHRVKKLEKQKKEGVIVPCDNFVTECETFKAKIINYKSAIDQKIILENKIKGVKDQIAIAVEKGHLPQTLQQFNPEQKSIACQLLGKDLDGRLACIHDAIAKALADKNYQAVFDRVPRRDHSLALQILDQEVRLQVLSKLSEVEAILLASTEYIKQVPYQTALAKSLDFTALIQQHCVNLLTRLKPKEAQAAAEDLSILAAGRGKRQVDEVITEEKGLSGPGLLKAIQDLNITPSLPATGDSSLAVQKQTTKIQTMISEIPENHELTEKVQALGTEDQLIARKLIAENLNKRIFNLEEKISAALETKDYASLFENVSRQDHGLAVNMLKEAFLFHLVKTKKSDAERYDAYLEFIEKTPYATGLERYPDFINVAKNRCAALADREMFAEAAHEADKLVLLSSQPREQADADYGDSGTKALQKALDPTAFAKTKQGNPNPLGLLEPAEAKLIYQSLSRNFIANDFNARKAKIEERISAVLETKDFADFFETVSREDHYFALKKLKAAFLLYLVNAKKTDEERYDAYLEFIEKTPYATGLERYPDFIMLAQNKCVALAHDLRFSEAINEAEKLVLLTSKRKEKVDPGYSDASADKLEKALDPAAAAGKSGSENSLQLQLLAPAKAISIFESLSRQLCKNQLEYRTMIGKGCTALFFNTLGEDWFKESKGNAKFLLRTLKSTHLLAEEALPVFAQFLSTKLYEKLSGKINSQIPQILWEIFRGNLQSQNKNLLALAASWPQTNSQWLPVVDQASALISTCASTALVWQESESQSPLLRKTLQFAQNIHLGSSALISSRQLIKEGWQALNVGVVSSLINVGNSLFLQVWRSRHQQKNFQQLPESKIFYILQDNVTDLIAPLYFIIQLLRTPVVARPTAWKLCLHQLGSMALVRALTFLYRFRTGYYDNQQNLVRLSNQQMLDDAKKRDTLKKLPIEKISQLFAEANPGWIGFKTKTLEYLLKQPAFSNALLGCLNTDSGSYILEIFSIHSDEFIEICALLYNNRRSIYSNVEKDGGDRIIHVSDDPLPLMTLANLLAVANHNKDFVTLNLGITHLSKQGHLDQHLLNCLLSQPQQAEELAVLFALLRKNIYFQAVELNAGSPQGRVSVTMEFVEDLLAPKVRAIIMDNIIFLKEITTAIRLFRSKASGIRNENLSILLRNPKYSVATTHALLDLKEIEFKGKDELFKETAVAHNAANVTKIIILLASQKKWYQLFSVSLLTPVNISAIQNHAKHALIIALAAEKLAAAGKLNQVGFDELMKNPAKAVVIAENIILSGSNKVVTSIVTDEDSFTAGLFGHKPQISVTESGNVPPATIVQESVGTSELHRKVTLV